MITRVWHGKTKAEHADSYLQFLLNEGTKDYSKTAGNISIRVWRKMENGYCHFYTVSEWENIDAIKQFAGENYEKAVYYPEDNGILLEFEERVNHYECYVVK